MRLVLLCFAYLFIQERICVNTSARQNLLTYAQGPYLDALGVFLSVDRLQASYAVTTIKFKLSRALANAYVISSGFEVTNGNVTFATDDELVIPPGELYGEVSATCKDIGEAGNGYLAGQITTVVKPMTFLESATNTTATVGGADAETDDEYAERIRLAPHSFSVAGPEKAYVYHAKSVSSAIIDVAVTSPEPGEVNVFPLLEGGELPSETLIEEVADHLSADDVRPLTDHVTVAAPKKREYAINLDYWILESDKDKADAIRANVETAVEAYRTWQQTKIGRDITPDVLIHNAIVAGAIRVDRSTLSPADFVSVADDEVAQCTGVTINYKGYKTE